jgi:hypothetical protein
MCLKPPCDLALSRNSNIRDQVQYHTSLTYNPFVRMSKLKKCGLYPYLVI